MADLHAYPQNSFQQWVREIDLASAAVNETAKELEGKVLPGRLHTEDLIRLLHVQTLQVQTVIMQAEFSLRHGPGAK